MSEDKKVVVIAMDESSDSEKALEFYVKNVQRENDEVVIIHCVHHKVIYTYQSVWTPVDPGAVYVGFIEDNKKGKEICDAIAQKLKTYRIEGKVIRLEGGDPGHVIINKANELKASLIIMGSRGMGTIRRTLLGSVSDYVIHHAHCPVIICRH